MPDTCQWREDFDGNYDTDCKQSFCMIDGTPEENGMRFCCYCGKPLTAVKCREAELSGGEDPLDLDDNLVGQREEG